MRKITSSLIAVSLLGMFTACSTKDDDSNKEGDKSKPVIEKSTFLDSVVGGLSFSCKDSGEKGMTKTDGVFTYAKDDTCTFSVGEVTVGDAKPSGAFTTPKDITSDSEKYTNILRFFQTLDSDANASNGITLPSGINGSVDFGGGFESDMSTLMSNNGITNPLVSADDAKAHFDSTQLKITLSGKHISFKDDSGDSVGEFYLYEDGSLSHDTADGSDSNVPGSWSINTKAQLVMKIGGDDTTYLKFDSVPPKVGTNATVIGDHEGVVSLSILEKISSKQLMIHMLSNKHISFEDASGDSAGDYYLKDDGTFTYDTPDGSDTDIPGTWEVDDQGRLKVDINNGREKMTFEFAETPVAVGVDVTISGSHSGSMSVSVFKKITS